MGLLQVATSTVTSSQGNVTLTGIDDDSVYLLTVNNLSTQSDAQLRLQFTVSGSADTSSNYDEAHEYLISNGAFSTFSRTNQSEITLTATVQNSVSGNANVICNLYNFNNASEYSFATVESSFYASTNNVRGLAGAGVLTENQSNDGINLLMNTGNITGGTFTLYKVV
tara:strand:+ start:395 stop:898 length:504 start_codon:yes stop_codon:yes gene_type:complete